MFFNKIIFFFYFNDFMFIFFGIFVLIRDIMFIISFVIEIFKFFKCVVIFIRISYIIVGIV